MVFSPEELLSDRNTVWLNSSHKEVILLYANHFQTDLNNHLIQDLIFNNDNTEIICPKSHSFLLALRELDSVQ